MTSLPGRGSYRRITSEAAAARALTAPLITELALTGAARAGTAAVGMPTHPGSRMPVAVLLRHGLRPRAGSACLVFSQTLSVVLSVAAHQEDGADGEGQHGVTAEEGEFCPRAEGVRDGVVGHHRADRQGEEARELVAD